MATPIVFGPTANDPIDIGLAEVWTRVRWADDWAQQFHLEPLNVVFSIPPAMPTATLLWRYGDIQQPDSPVFTTEIKKQLQGQYVKIRLRTNRDASGAWQDKFWYGVIRVDDDKQAGFSELPAKHATGRQEISCYGLEQLLAEQQIRASYWQTFGDPQRTERALVFNRGQLQNRTAVKFAADTDFPNNQAHVFTEPQLQGANWSTRDIAEYLITFIAPRDPRQRVRVPFQFSEPVAGSIPTWDRPEFDASDQSVFSALTRLCPIERQLTWYLEVEEKAGETDIIWTRFRTATATPIDPVDPEAQQIPANPVQFDLIYDRDTLSSGSVQKDELTRVDQVVVTGARRRSLASYSLRDVTLNQGWGATEQTAYNNAASGEPGYGALTEAQQRAANAQARNRPELDDVFALFIIPDGWNRKANNGEGTGTPSPVFPGTITAGPNGPILPDDPYPVYAPDIFADQSIPLLGGVDYTGIARDENNPAQGRHDEAQQSQRLEVAPLVFFKRPENGQWAAGDNLSLDVELLEPGENPNFAVFVTVPPRTRGVKLKITGQPAHIIDKGTVDPKFVPLPVDQDVGTYELHDMILTFAVFDDRRAEGKYPDDIFLVNDPIDTVKRQYINAGEGYRQDFITKDTVVGVNASGLLVRAADWLFINDDESKLRQVARVAYEWYRVPRTTVALETNRLTNLISIGDIIASVGEDDPLNQHRELVNTMVTEIRYDLPSGLPESPQAPQMQLTTSAGEFSALLPLPDAVEPELPEPDEVLAVTDEQRFEAFVRDLRRVETERLQSTGSVFDSGER